MSKDFTGPLSLENLDAQFCSDWLRGEIRRVLKENERLTAEKESWGNEFTAVCAAKEEIERLKAECDRLKSSRNARKHSIRAIKENHQ